MNLPQFVFIAGPDDSAKQLAERIHKDDPEFMPMNLDEAPKEFGDLFMPGTTLDRVIEMLYNLDVTSVGNAAFQMYKMFADGDPWAKAVIYPVRQLSDTVAFSRGRPLSDCLLVNMLGKPIRPWFGTTIRIPTFAFDHTNIDADWQQLQLEFTNLMRQSTEPQP